MGILIYLTSLLFVLGATCLLFDGDAELVGLLVVLGANAVGVIVYGLLAPKRKLPDDHPDVILAGEDDPRPVSVEGNKAWNPIQGYNDNNPGDGFNLREEDDAGDEAGTRNSRCKLPMTDNGEER